MKTTSFMHEDALIARANRNDAYSSGFDHLEYNAVRGAIDDKIYRMYWNINLYVDISSVCNCFCSFCINCAAYERKDTTDEFFVENLESALQGIRHLDPSIQIVGGEPTLKRYRPRLQSILDLVKKYRIRKPIIGTNGTGLVDPEFVDHVNGYLSHINISRHHYDDATLNTIWVGKNPLSNKKLGAVLKTPLGEKVRLNCVLLKDAIDNHSEIVKYLEWATSLGVKNVSFSTLSILPEGYIYSDPYIDQVDILGVPFDKIMRDIDNDERFSFLKYHTGTHCMYELWLYEHEGVSCTVVFATSDNTFAQRLDEIPDLIELLVYHTDGSLTASWNRDIKQIRPGDTREEPLETPAQLVQIHPASPLSTA